MPVPVRNMTVVIHSFDVFELLVLPFDWGLLFEFSLEFSIFVILLFDTFELLILPFDFGRSVLNFPRSSIFLYFLLNSRRFFCKFNLSMGHASNVIERICLMVFLSYLMYIVFKGTRIIIKYVRRTFRLHKTYQWRSDQNSCKAKQVQNWRALRTHNSKKVVPNTTKVIYSWYMFGDILKVSSVMLDA